MPLSARHAEAIHSLSVKQFRELVSKVKEAFRIKRGLRTPDQLVTLCRTPAVHPADLGMPFAREVDELSVAILEALMGHRITRAPTADERKAMYASSRKRHSPATVPKGTSRRAMVVRIATAHKAANPHSPGTGVYTRWTYYRDGAPVDEFIQRGGRMEDVVFHERKGFITLELPK